MPRGGRRGGATRRERAQLLLMRAQQGPTFSGLAAHGSQAPAVREYQDWFRAWVESELVDLIPELQVAAKLEARGIR